MIESLKQLFKKRIQLESLIAQLTDEIFDIDTIKRFVELELKKNIYEGNVKQNRIILLNQIIVNKESLKSQIELLNDEFQRTENLINSHLPENELLF